MRYTFNQDDLGGIISKYVVSHKMFKPGIKLKLLWTIKQGEGGRWELELFVEGKKVIP